VSENNLEDLSHSAKKVFYFISSKGAFFFEEIFPDQNVQEQKQEQKQKLRWPNL
jgi:hypothetical protein